MCRGEYRECEMWHQGGASDFALGFGDVLGGALCFGLYLGFRRGTWEVLWFWIVFGLSVWDLRGALCFGVLEG